MVIDDCTDASRWLPVASGLAQLTVASERTATGAALRLDFDFKGGGGFVVIRRTLSLPLPETYVIAFDVRGAAPANKLELKLSDQSGQSVWWWHRDALVVHEDWEEIRVRSSDITFAWGPAGGGVLAEAGALEIAIVAGPGGRGTMWIENLRLEDRTYRGVPHVTASSTAPGSDLQSVFDRSTVVVGALVAPPRRSGDVTSWRSLDGRTAQWLLIDFGSEREYGGIVIDWEPGRAARDFTVQISNDGAAWTAAYRAPLAGSERSYVYMPATTARYLRLDLNQPVDAAAFGIRHIEIRPYEFSRSLQTFFQSLAHDAPRGDYPKYFANEQTYWSPVGVADGTSCAVFNEEGMIEFDRGSCSIEPSLWVDDRLITWADANVTQELDAGYLPIPSSVWRTNDLTLRVTAYAARAPEAPVLFIRYRVENAAPRPRTVRLCAALRPFQVTPPWQAYQDLGGVRSIRRLRGDGRVVQVDGDISVVALTDGGRFGAVAFAQGSIVDWLRRGELPAQSAVEDSFGYASGALVFDLPLPEHGSSDVYLAVPFAGAHWEGEAPAEPHEERSSSDRGGSAGASSSQLHDIRTVDLADVAADWQTLLSRVSIELPAAGRAFVETFKSAAAHILINRDGAALQPGPRRYTRSWVRDGATMAAALLRIGCAEPASAFIRWYAGYQAADGAVPCCVDRNGPDWLVEHDSHGQLIFTVMDCFRFTGDRQLLQELWPHVITAVDHVEKLRNTRLGTEYETGERRDRYGLLPESASHEGYLAHPVHAYWDDFWAVRGLGDAAAIAEVLGFSDQALRIAALRVGLRDSLYASLALTMAERKLDYVPGSVEWADFDPTATANAVSLLGELPRLPRAALERTFDIYLEGFRRRCRHEIEWVNYTAYEVRIVGALVHLGRRADANELLAYLINDRRPMVWNQWPEISWRDPKSPGHLGDVPHTWIAAEYMLAFRSMLVLEHESDLVIGAGVPDEWLDGDGITVKDLPTYHGVISFRLRRVSAAEIQLTIAGELTARIVVRPPLPGPLQSVEIDGYAADTFDAASVWFDPGVSEVRLWSAPRD